MKRLTLVAALLVAAACPALSNDDAVARRLFAAASELEKSGQVEPARRSYQQVVDGSPESAWADDALLALARLEWPVDDPAGLGSAGTFEGARLKRARELLDVVVGRYVASDSAPEATWRLALLLLEPSYPGRDPDEAVARLVSLPTVYPDSRFAPRALALAATIDERAGRNARARASSFELLSRWPARREAAVAWLVAGRLLAGERRWGEALHALGRAQAVGGEGGRLRGEAARLATLIDRLAFRVPAPGAALAPTPEGATSATGRVDDLAVSPDGRLALLSARDGTFTLRGSAGSVDQGPAPGARCLAFDGEGRLWRAGSAVSAPDGVGSFATQAGLEIVAIAPVDVSRAWVLDARERRALLLRRDGSVAHRAALPERARPSRLVGDGQDGAWILDDRARLLHRVDPEGRALTRIDLSSRVERPDDLAIDALGNLYLLDGRARRVHVLDPAGTPLFVLSLPAEGALAFERPAALAVDGAGGVAIYDSRTKRIQWLR